MYARRRADPENVAALRHLTIELAADAGATPDQLADVALAVSAALMNAVRYGYPDCGTPGDMSVRATAADHVLEIEVSDEGIGMPASTADHDREMGHALIGQVTDTFTVDTERSWGVRVHMTFELG